MTPKKFFLLGILLVVILGFIKYIFINYLAEDGGALFYTELALIALASMAVSRRLGVINFLEAFLVVGMWWLFALVFDFLITSAFVGFEVFKSWHYWLTFIVMGLAILIFHKKRHVKLRHELHH